MEGQSRDGEASIVFLLFSGHFCGAGLGLDGGRQSHDGGYPSPPPPLKPCRLIFLVLDPLL